MGTLTKSASECSVKLNPGSAFLIEGIGRRELESLPNLHPAGGRDLGFWIATALTRLAMTEENHEIARHKNENDKFV